MGFRTFYEQSGGAQDILSNQKRMSDDLVTVFGRHNPPHIGHGLTLDGADKLAGSIGDNAPAEQRFYTSRSQDRKKNPLPFDLKTSFLKEMFPKHADKWDGDDNVRTILGAATKAHDQGYKNFHFVGGGDRRQGMEDLLRRYNGNLYDFDNIYSHSVGDRIEDEQEELRKTDTSGMSDKAKEDLKKKILLAGMSASKMRRMAQSGDLENFTIGAGGNKDLAKRIFDAVQMFGQKNEDWEIAPRYNQSTIREMYLAGYLYEEGDIVESMTSGLVGRVHRCGTNHLICVTEDNIMFKNFVHDVQYLNN